MQSKKFNKIKDQMVESLELPKDIIYGAVILNITGRNEILIENYKGILEYTQEVIWLQTKNCRLKILGRQLTIQYYTSEEMRITGIVNSIEYES